MFDYKISANLLLLSENMDLILSVNIFPYSSFRFEIIVKKHTSFGGLIYKLDSNLLITMFKLMNDIITAAFI